MSGSPKTTILAKLSSLGLGGKALALTGVVALAWLIIAPVAYVLSGGAGLLAAATGALLCWSGGELALLIASLFRTPNAAMFGLHVGMFPRPFLPLQFGVILHLRVPELAQSRMIISFLIFYAATLVTETALALAHVRQNLPSREAI